MKKAKLLSLLFLNATLLSVTAQQPVLTPVFPTPLPVNSFTGNEQSEVHISVDKANPGNLIVAANTLEGLYTFSSGYPQEEGCYTSHDGGNTWASFANNYYLDDFPNKLPPNNNVYGDPSTAVDADGTMYVSTMNFFIPTIGPPLPSKDRYLLDISTDHGNTWTLQDPGTIIAEFDKDMIAADDVPTSLYKNNLYCTYTSVSSGGIYLQKYTQKPNPTFSTPITLISGAEQGPNVETGPNGEVYVCWANYAGSGGATSLGFTLSKDGGATFTPLTGFAYQGYDATLGENDVGGADFNTNVRVNCFPSMAVDKSCGPNRGMVYVVYGSYDYVTSAHNNKVVELRTYNPNTSIWSAPILISPTSSSTNSFFPWVAVDDVTGIVYVDYYTCDNTNWTTDTYLSYSLDGVNFTTGINLSNTAHLLTVADGNDGYAGDYIGITAHNGIAYPGWMDNNNGNYVYNVYVTPVSFQPIKITSNTVWTSNVLAPGDIEVTAPNTLTINSGVVVKMGPTHNIFVDPGAKLIVNGTITSSSCEDMWNGISVEGNSSADQYSSNTQGQVILYPGSRIEYALNGITTGTLTAPNTWATNSMGGIIEATGATFYNCQCAVNYLKFTNTGLGHANLNKGIFTNCTFETDNSYIPFIIKYPLTQVVNLNQVHGIQFFGNTFENNLTPTISTYTSGIGIESFNSSYNVTNCNAVNIFTGLCGGTPNTFSGYEYGIFISNANPANAIQIIGNKFTNNFRDVYLNNANYTIVNQNSFLKNQKVGSLLFCGACPPYNLYLNQCTGYSIQQNSFTVNGTGPANSYGIIDNNSGTNNNLIYNNTFTGHYVGTQSQGTNGLVTTIVTGSFPYFTFYTLYTGLQVECNQFTSSVTYGADISVTSGMMDLEQGSCSSPATTANNTFPYTCSTPHRNNIDVYAGLLPYYIYYAYSPSVLHTDPTCISGPVYTSPLCTFSSSTCTSLGNNNGGSGSGGGSPAALTADRATSYSKAATLENELAAGNAAGIYQAIAQDPPGQVQNVLLAVSPYVADSALILAIKAGLPNGILKNILLANSPLDNSVLAALNQANLPNGIKNQIMAAQNGTPPKQALNNEISQFLAEANIDLNGLLRYYLNDSARGIDTAGLLLENVQPAPNIDQLMQLSYIQLQNNQFSDAAITFQRIALQNNPAYSDYLRLFPILLNLQQSPQGMSSLMADSALIPTVNGVAGDSALIGSGGARGLMSFVFGNQYFQTIEPLPNQNNERILGQENTVNYPPVDVKVYPNPANTSINIESEFANGETQNMCIYNSLGEKVRCIELTETLTSLNVSDLAQGIYFYRITDMQGNLIKADKVMLVH